MFYSFNQERGADRMADICNDTDESSGFIAF
jgi:hypothetical protein